MEKFLRLKICLSSGLEPKFGLNRPCFEGEKPKEGTSEQPKKKPVNLSEVGNEVSEEESREALEKAKTIHAERKEVVAGTKEELAALRASLGPLPGSPEAKKKQEEEAKKKEAESKGKEKDIKMEGPRIPERAKDAMNGSELMDAFKKCRSTEEKQLLILDQLAKGNVPDSFRSFQKIKVERNGKTMEFLAAPSGLRLGTDQDSIEFPMNGPLAQAVADATGCSLPNQWMVDRMYEEGKKNGQFIPFAPQVFSKEDAARMRSPEFIQAHDDKYKKWAEDHNIDLTKPIFGYFKHVIQQEPSTRAGQRLEIYGGIYQNGGTVQPMGVGHDIYHDDYSQNVQLIAGTVYVDGKPMSLQDVLSDSDLAGTFGFNALPKENRYQYSPVLAQTVARIQTLTPGPTVLASAEKKPAPVFEGITQEDIQKGKVTEEFDYTVAHGAPGGHVRFVKTDAGNVAVMEWQGKEYQLKVDLNNDSGVDKAKTGYTPSGSEIAGPFGYVLLRYFREHGHKVGDIVPFEFNGKQFVAEYQIHPPDASAPTDHPGVGIMQKKETDQYSQIPNAPGLAFTGQPPKSGDVIAPQKPADLIVPPPRVGGPGVKVATGGGSYGGGGPGYGGGGAPSYAPSPGPSYASYSPSPGPAYVPSYAPPSGPDKAKQAPVERKEGAEYIIHGSTLFLGDSNTVGAFNRANINVDGNIHTIAKGSMDADWVLTQLQEFEKTGELKNFKNMVVTAGVNGIGRGPVAIFNTLKKIWEIGKKYGIKVYEGTLAPFKGWSNFGAGYEKYNEIRKEVNRMIRESHQKDGIPEAIIPYDELCADPNDPDSLAPEYDSGDHLHIKKAANAKLVASVAGERLGGGETPAGPEDKKPEAKEGTGDLADFEKSPFFDERTKTYAFPEGDPDPLRIHVNAPGNYDKNKPTRVVMFALPAGNTIEQTIGAQKKPGQDWHFEIQQIGAQTRKLRETSPNENIVVAYIEAPKLNPGAWHKDDPGRGELIGRLIQDVKTKIGAPSATVDISGHSAGRSFQYGYIDALPQIPDDVKRLSFLDSNHSYNEARINKIMTWLQSAGQDHYLTVISYDDRNVTLNGQPVPGAVGYERTTQMIEYFQKNGIELAKEQKNGYVHYTGLNGRVNFLMMDNPDNKILHTETVFRNGLIYAETAGTPLDGKAGEFNGQLTFGQYIQESPADLHASKPGQPKPSPEVQGALDQVDYTINQGAPGGVISYYPTGEAKMTFQGKEYNLKVDTKYQTPDLTKPPQGYTINANPSLMPAVIDFAMLHSMLKWNKPQGTEMPFEYEGVQYIAKLAWHTDHPGADLYVKA